MLEKHPTISAIHLNDGLMAMVCHWLPGYTKVPVLVNLHGLDVVYTLPIFQKMIKKCYSKFSRLITVSEATRMALIDHGLAPEKVVTIHNGVDHSIDNFNEVKKTLNQYIGQSISKDTMVLAGLGRQVKRKGFSWFLKNVMPYLDDRIIFILIGPRKELSFLLKVLRKVLPAKTRSYLDLLLGYASDQDEVFRIISSEKLHGKVFHLDSCSYNDVMNILSKSDVMVMPNIAVKGDAEGFGLVALETSINGTPVLASRIDGIKDAVHEGKNGWLLPSGDQLSWINKIDFLVNGKELVRKAGRNAHFYSTLNFSWDKMVVEYLEEIEKLQSLSSIRKYNYRIKPQSVAV